MNFKYSNQMVQAEVVEKLKEYVILQDEWRRLKQILSEYNSFAGDPEGKPELHTSVIVISPENIFLATVISGKRRGGKQSYYHISEDSGHEILEDLIAISSRTNSFKKQIEKLRDENLKEYLQGDLDHSKFLWDEDFRMMGIDENTKKDYVPKRKSFFGEN